MKKFLLTGFFLFAISFFTSAQIPNNWNSVGPGGGGALFNPSINPANTDEYYVACDMSGYYHTTDDGLTYSTLNFNSIQSGSNGVIRFTNDANILYAVQDANDLAVPVKSTDGGQTWNTLPGNPDPFEYVYYLYADYENPNIMIMSYYNKVYITVNGGNTFTLVHNANSSGSGIVIGGAFFDGNNIYLGTNDGLYVSANGGSSFSLNNSAGIPSTQGIYSFAGAKVGGTTRFYILVASKTNIYAGFAGYDYWGFVKGVYALDYGAGTWVQKQTGINLNTDFLMEVAMAENDINTCYLAGSNTTGYPNVMKTTDGGTSWSHVFNAQGNVNINSGWCGSGGDRDWGYAEVFFGLCVAKNDANKILCTDFGFVHKSNDGGSTWQQAYVNPADQNSPGSSTPKGKNYHGIGIENTSCWQVMWIDQNNLWAGYSDIRGVRSTDGGASWNFNYTGNDQNTTYRIVRNPSNGYLYAALSTIHDMYQSTRLQDAVLDVSNSGKIMYSTDNGVTWLLLHDFSHPVFWLSLDPNNPNILYASIINHGSNLGGIYKTSNLQNNASSVWSKLPAPPRTEGHPATVIVLNDGNVICTYSGRRDVAGAFTTSSGVFLYNGNSWTDLSVNPGMYYWCKDIVVDPNDANQNTWYVCVFKGWGSTQVNNAGGGLYRTTDRGAHWTKINSLDRVTSVTFDPNNADRIYMTTEMEGLWYSDNINDASPTFTQITSYPFRQPERVFFNPYNQSEVWVTSFGNGIRIGSSCISPSVTISAGGATSFCKGGNVTLTAAAIGVVSFQWKKNGNNISGATNASYAASTTGDYIVAVSSSCGTASSNSIHVTQNPNPPATITPPGTVSICQGESIVLTANSGTGLGYQWIRNGTNISGATTGFYTATTAGNYKVKVTKSATGCMKTSAATKVTITCKEDLETDNFRLEVFPNPSAGDFTIHLTGDGSYDLRLFDILGRKLKSLDNIYDDIRLQNLKQGIYLLEVRKGDQLITTRKIIKTED
jgi:photosystem II stability/assembly factor-like uncharacterized protein